MKIKGEGFYLSCKKYGENSFIIYIFSKKNGLIKGFTKLSKKKKIPLTNLDKINFEWNSRNPDGLGFLKFDICGIDLNRHSSFIFSLIIASASELCLKLLPLQQCYNEIYTDLEKLVNYNHKSFKNLISKYISWEINFLKHTGYGLNFSECIVTGKKEDVFFISPKSGNSVSYKIGKKYKKKLFEIPLCFKEENSEIEYSDYLRGLEIIGYFLRKSFEEYKFDLIFRKQLLNKVKSLSIPS